MSRSKYVVFQFSYPPTTLGLDIGTSQQEALQLAAQVHTGDTLTIYYDASGSLLHQQPTTLAYQVEITGRQTLYSLAEMRRRYWWHAALYGVVMLVFMGSTPAKATY